MPKQVSQLEYETLIRIVQKFANGASIKDIVESGQIDISRRTLQRHLSELVKAERLVIDGHGRGTRYQILTRKTDIESEPTLTDAVENYIPVSAEGHEIKQAIRASVQDRLPVGYNRDFLNHYRPNETVYLPGAMRDKLHDLGRTPEGEEGAGTYARQIHHRLLIDLSWNSSRLEGNTYSLLETDRLLNSGEFTEGKSAIEAQMILNHKEAINLLVENAGVVGFNRHSILNLHALLSDNLLGNPQACGRVRSTAVDIVGTTYYPLDIPQLIDEYFQQILDTTAAIIDPFEQAFFVMVHLPYLQPFVDVNKRVSRLAANIPFIQNNLCPLSFIDVPDRAYIDGILGVYELNRIELLRDVFCWAYERSSLRYSVLRRTLLEPDHFRLRHRKIIIDTVRKIVIGKLDKPAAIAYLRSRAAEEMTPELNGRFVEVVETEVMALHEGNIARFRLAPTEYAAWVRVWQ